MGETWVALLVSSNGIGGAGPVGTAFAVGVAGVCNTLPMNQDLMELHSSDTVGDGRRKTYWYPSSISAVFFHGLELYK